MITTVLIIAVSVFFPIKLIYFFRGKQFGGKVRQEHLSKYARSSHWDGEKFINLEETTVDVNVRTLPRLLKLQLKGRSERNPREDLPIIPTDSKDFEEKEGPKFIWYGHSVLLLQMAGRNLLIDPMFGPDASPIAPVTSRRFSAGTLSIIDQLPDLDAILITHDHYDHLDFASIARLKEKADTFYVAMGVSRHLERWGIPSSQITEFDWWDEDFLDPVRLIFTPSRHFSGRGPTDRTRSLWGGWVFMTDSHRIYWTGDGGYGNHFKQVGERYGPFQWIFTECGQYNELWHQIHMYPEECVQAALDAGAQVAMPVHWAGFTLAMHHWKEPVNRFVRAAGEKGLEICCPPLGQLVKIDQKVSWEPWWDRYH